MEIDVTDATFEQDVIERSRTAPVVVDFWAAWCGPCRQLTPVLERGVEKYGDEVTLAKVDVDANPGVAARYDVRGIPAVKAFRDGRVVDEFTGAVPPATVEAFLAALVPSEADRLVEQGDEASLRRAIELEPARADARVALARATARPGRVRGCARAAATGRPRPRRFGAARPRRSSPPILQRPKACAPRSPRSSAARRRPRWKGCSRPRSSSNGEARDSIRRAMIGIFGELGDDNPVSVSYRKQLARALY